MGPAVRLRFTPDVAHLVAERKIHPSQAAKWRSDDSLDVELRAPVTPALARWLLGWGGAVHIVTPVVLRKRVGDAHVNACGIPAE